MMRKKLWCSLLVTCMGAAFLLGSADAAVTQLVSSQAEGNGSQGGPVLPWE
ncbi:hypothetical protein [Paenibacillus sp. 481]|uniref:hypothetical protein n=1 Tax=Paenibacillus sp. 481 TaxID=2835869 RepID=UPI001E401E4A|nr:hypothetical protein [Paenibacillus sp. 481]UHA72163.1 hypothetical protein KIK04_15820 [Paenibacillus sp. 481]